MKTDQICDHYSGKSVGLSLRMLDSETMLIEGTKEALHFLAQLLMAVADEPANDGFQISPSGAGSEHFSADARLGVYIHRRNQT